MRGRAYVAIWVGVVALTPVIAGCGASRDPNTDELKIGAYSVVREVLHDGLLPAFAAEWKGSTGRAFRFDESYLGSGAQARAIAGGFDADVAILSHEGDMEVLVKAGCVKPTWKDGPTRGMISNSLVVIGIRSGNPKGIKDWTDLAKPGVGVLYPDPKTSGGARWNINAIYGSAFLASGEANSGKPDLGAVRDFLAQVQANVVNMDQSGRQSMANFTERGTGDAVVTYENELLLQNKESEPIPYVVPTCDALDREPGSGGRDRPQVAWEPCGCRGVSGVFAVGAGAENPRRVWIPAGEARDGGTLGGSGSPFQALHDRRSGRVGQPRGGTLWAQGAVDIDLHCGNDRTARRGGEHRWPQAP